MNFDYRAKDLIGTDHSGMIESADEHSAALILRKKGLIVISITPKATSRENLFDRIFHRVKFGDLVIMTRQLATMVGAGLVLSEAIDLLQEQQTNKKFKKALSGISDDLKGGLTLANALSKYRDIFPQLFINLIKSGEKSGKLDEVLLKMADSLEKDREFRAKIKGAMIYPIVVVTMMMVVILIMMIFVIPRLLSLYTTSNIELPLPTKILIGVSSFISTFWWVIIIVVVGAVVALRRWIKTPEGRLAYDTFLLRLPLIGKVITNVTLTNFNRTFGLLISAGVPLLEVISIVQDLTDNSVFRNALRETYAGVERGLTLSAQLANFPVFPKLVSQMIKVGEETGKIDEIFYRLTDYYEQESDQLVKNLTVAIEPIVLIILGLGVAFLVISIILPIYKLTTSF